MPPSVTTKRRHTLPRMIGPAWFQKISGKSSPLAASVFPRSTSTRKMSPRREPLRWTWIQDGSEGTMSEDCLACLRTTTVPLPPSVAKRTTFCLRAERSTLVVGLRRHRHVVQHQHYDCARCHRICDCSVAGLRECPRMACITLQRPQCHRLLRRPLDTGIRSVSTMAE